MLGARRAKRGRALLPRGIRRLLGSLPRARRLIAYSSPGADDRAGQDFDIHGRLSGAHLDDVVPTDADF